MPVSHIYLNEVSLASGRYLRTAAKVSGTKYARRIAGLAVSNQTVKERVSQMKTVTDSPEQQQLPAENHHSPFVPRLRKHTYVLPSGRVLKVVVDDDSELMAGAAPAC
jgi:succinylarginine dihydrolase